MRSHVSPFSIAKRNSQIPVQRSRITININCLRVRSFNATDQFRADVLLSIHIVGIVAISWHTIILLLAVYLPCVSHYKQIQQPNEMYWNFFGYAATESSVCFRSGIYIRIIVIIVLVLHT